MLDEFSAFGGFEAGNQSDLSFLMNGPLSMTCNVIRW